MALTITRSLHSNSPTWNSASSLINSFAWAAAMTLRACAWSMVGDNRWMRNALSHGAPRWLVTHLGGYDSPLVGWSLRLPLRLPRPGPLKVTNGELKLSIQTRTSWQGERACRRNSKVGLETWAVRTKYQVGNICCCDVWAISNSEMGNGDNAGKSSTKPC